MQQNAQVLKFQRILANFLVFFGSTLSWISGIVGNLSSLLICFFVRKQLWQQLQQMSHFPRTSCFVCKSFRQSLQNQTMPTRAGKGWAIKLTSTFDFLIRSFAFHVASKDIYHKFDCALQWHCFDAASFGSPSFISVAIWNRLDS